MWDKKSRNLSQRGSELFFLLLTKRIEAPDSSVGLEGWLTGGWIRTPHKRLSGSRSAERIVKMDELLRLIKIWTLKQLMYICILMYIIFNVIKKTLWLRTGFMSYYKQKKAKISSTRIDPLRLQNLSCSIWSDHVWFLFIGFFSVCLHKSAPVCLFL